MPFNDSIYFCVASRPDTPISNNAGKSCGRLSTYLLAILAVTTVSISNALATTLPPPSFQNIGLEYPVQNFLFSQNSPGTLAQPLTGIYGNGFGVAILAVSPSPFLYSSVNGIGAGTGSVEYLGSSSELIYEAQVTGPAGTQVPVNFASTGSASSSGAGLSESAFFLDALPAGGFAYQFIACSDSQNPNACSQIGSPNSSFNVTQQLLLTPGVPVEIFLLASSGSFDTPGNSFASAQVDPYIYIDPSFANADQYSIEVSAGVGNSPPPVPEPSTLALLGTGALGLVGVARRKGAGQVGRVARI